MAIVIPEDKEKYLKLQRSGSTVEEAILSCKKDLELVLKLKPTGNSIIDIGCGLGIMMSHLKDEFKFIHLLDKTGLEVNKRTTLYDDIESMGFYTDLEFAEELVKNNTNSIVKTFTPDTMPNYKYDVITSFYSWGFHYPIEVYSDWAIFSLAQEGSIIITVRNELINNIITLFSEKDKVVNIVENRKSCSVVCIS